MFKSNKHIYIKISNHTLKHTDFKGRSKNTMGINQSYIAPSTISISEFYTLIKKHFFQIDDSIITQLLYDKNFIDNNNILDYCKELVIFLNTLPRYSRVIHCNFQLKILPTKIVYLNFGKPIFKTELKANIIYHLVKIYEEKINEYLKLSPHDKLQRILSKFNINLHITGKFYSYLSDYQNLYLSKNTNPSFFVNFLEKDNLNTPSYLNFLFLYALGFNGINEKIIYIPHFIINSLRFGDGKTLIKKYSLIEPFIFFRFTYRNHEYIVINISDENNFKYQIDKEINLVYNYTNAQPIKNTSKLYRKILFYFYKEKEHLWNSENLPQE